jgi:hypothetical protein
VIFKELEEISCSLIWLFFEQFPGGLDRITEHQRQHCSYEMRTFPPSYVILTLAGPSDHAPAAIVGSNPTGGVNIFLLCVLSGRGLCDDLITRPDESFRLWCIIVSRNLVDEEAVARAGLPCQRK